MEIDKAIILMAGKAERLKEDPLLTIIPTKSFFLVRRIPKEETILSTDVKTLKDLGIKEVYIIVPKKTERDITNYIEKIKKGEKIDIKINVVPQKYMETGNRILKLKEKFKDVFLICYGDEVFDGDINKEFKSFIEKSKEIIEKESSVVLIRAVIDPENYKGGVESFENQTKCRLRGNKIIWAAKKEFLPRENGKVLLFTSFMVATPKIFKMIEKFQKETGKEQVSLHDLDFTNFLIKEGVLYGVEVELNYFNINTKEDKQKLHEYFTIKDFEKLKNKTYSVTKQ
jgi:dTDP-glucose pyrophosphorylase